MSSAKFIASLDLADPAGKTAVITNLKPFRVLVQKAANSPDGELPCHEAGDVPAAPDVWLQIWSMGANEAAKWRGPPALKPTGGQNQLCTEIPGAICATADGYEFRALGAPAPGSGNPLGWMKLKLADPAGKPWLNNGKEYHAQITADGVEDEVDVACTLQKAAGGTAAPTKAHVFTFTNLNHVIGSQLKEGGLTLGFHVHCPHSTTGSNPDNSFRMYGQWGARRAHALGVKDGELTIGSSGFEFGEQNIIDAMTQVIDKVHKEFLLGQGAKPKVKRFFTCTHGDSHNGAVRIVGMKVGENGAWLTLDTKERFEKFLDQLAPMLAGDSVWAQCSCHCAAPPEAAPSGDYCMHPKDPKVGTGSFTDLCRKGLAKRGVGDVAVWGHTSKGDAIRNTQLRAFTQHGNMDLAYMVLGWPGKSAPTACMVNWAWFSGAVQTTVDRSKEVWGAFDASLKNPSELIKKIYGAG